MITAIAHAKINWSLDILGRRDDGYHMLDMLMQRIELSDELTFEDADSTTLRIEGRSLSSGDDNLILRAVHALRDQTRERREVQIHLKKRIPMRAGLGGGSADCAATLIALNQFWALNLTVEELCAIGSKLGADVPYCIRGGLCRVTGIGDRIEALGSAPRIPLVLLHPGDGLSTQAVYREFDIGYDALNVDTLAVARAVQTRNIADYCEYAGNALEAPAIRLMPMVRSAMDALANVGASAVRMTGSGSAVFGVFDCDESARRAAQALPGAILTCSLAE